MSYLLDTNVISELRKRPGVAHPSVIGWADARPVTELYLSVITVLELELGVLRIERCDPAQGRVLRRWLEDRVLTMFGERVIAMDISVAQRAARHQVPDPGPDRDAMIAATAQAHGLTVVTRNVADFAPMGVPTLNPWD